jgi:signal-transduction protein with cAMP-binding, CBS, and nucleotidyltransferase domain
MIRDETIQKMLSIIELELVSDDKRNIVSNKEQFEHFYMIKQGTVKCFDSQYNYISTLQEGSSFGEYNILFGLYSNITYKPDKEQN